MDEKLATANATLASAQEFATAAAAAAASSHTQLTNTATEMNNSMKLIQKDIEEMKKINGRHILCVNCIDEGGIYWTKIPICD